VFVQADYGLNVIIIERMPVSVTTIAIVVVVVAAAATAAATTTATANFVSSNCYLQ
jgi:hypothetical protein